MSNHTDFLAALTRELHGWQDETLWLNAFYVGEMLKRASSAVLPDELPQITLRHEYDPEDLKVSTILELDDSFIVRLDADEVNTLRALLMGWDESRPPTVGDALSIPCQMPGGEVITEITQELLDWETADDE